MLKILSLPGGEDGCFSYRIRQPLEAINENFAEEFGKGSKCAHIIDLKTDNMEALARTLPEIDVILMRPGSEKGAENIKNLGIPLKCKWVMDVDDNTDLISPYSQFYKEYGTKEFPGIWKNEVNGFSVFANINRVTYLKHGIKTADLVICTTEKLAEWVREMNQNVYVNDNTINFNHWWRMNNRENKPLKVLWGGSPSHYEDFYSIKEPLNRLMKEFDFEVYMLGSAYMGIFDEENRKRVIVKPWVTFKAHSYRMMAMQADVGIIPLADLPFNWYKSAIKWYEHSAMGLPSVVANVTPYKEVIKDMKTALAYNNPTEFYDKMKLLLTNKGMRANIANAAYLWVKENKDQKKQAVKLLERLEELCQK